MGKKLGVYYLRGKGALPLSRKQLRRNDNNGKPPKTRKKPPEYEVKENQSQP